MLGYRVQTIGELLHGGLAGQEWPPIPDGPWRNGVPGAPGSPAASAPSAADAPSVNGYAVAGVAVGGVLVGALGLWAWTRYG